jgi:serine/threonine protein phosphatase PrpC
MITSEPDIVQIALRPDDEFLVLGCDGIWDCLSNENAVDYVRSRIDVLSPTEIGTALLDHILSDDPRVTQGIGGDNMTVMIIDLQPGRRARRNKTATEEATATAAAPPPAALAEQ